MVKKKQKNPRTKGNGEGTVYKNAKGKWLAQITIGRNPSTGKIIRKSFSADTKKAALRRKDEYISSIINGTYVDPKSITVHDWLFEWLKTYKLNKVSPRTYDNYELTVIRHLANEFGRTKLQSLKTEHVQKLINQKLETGNMRGKGGLSRCSVDKIRMTLNQAMEKALQLSYISKNPVTYVTLPKNPKPSLHFLTLQDEESILQAINPEDSIGLAILFDFATGLRQGELIPLTWDDIDFEEHVVHINKTRARIVNRDPGALTCYKFILKEPKSTLSIREVPIPLSIIPLLKKHKTRSIQNNLREGRINDEYNLVFPNEVGTYIDPSNLRRYWCALFVQAEVEMINFHSIRHSYATRLIEHNLNIKILQVLLGHSSVSITLDIYCHVSNDLKKKHH